MHTKHSDSCCPGTGTWKGWNRDESGICVCMCVSVCVCVCVCMVSWLKLSRPLKYVRREAREEERALGEQSVVVKQSGLSDSADRAAG
jgi:L-lactate utilization protein LutB